MSGTDEQGSVPLLQVSRGRAQILLQRPEKRNRLEPSDLEVLIDHIDTIEKDRSVRIVTVEAKGPSWCSGYHLGALSQGERPKFGFGEVCDALMSLRPPTVAVLNGDVHGGGTDLAIACDLRIATRQIVLAMPATRIGLQYYASGLQRFVERIGAAATKRIFLTAEVIDAEELLRVGYLTEIVEQNELDARLDDLCESISALSPNAVSLTKKAIDMLAGSSPDLQQIEDNHVSTTRSTDHQEAMRAIREGRPPQFLID